MQKCFIVSGLGVGGHRCRHRLSGFLDLRQAHLRKIQILMYCCVVSFCKCAFVHVMHSRAFTAQIMTKELYLAVSKIVANYRKEKD